MKNFSLLSKALVSGYRYKSYIIIEKSGDEKKIPKKEKWRVSDNITNGRVLVYNKRLESLSFKSIYTKNGELFINCGNKRVPLNKFI